MGQMAVGILYGVEAPALPTDESEEPLHDLVYRWEKAHKITWESKGPKIRVESEGDKTLLGVWVAVGGSGEDDAPHFLDQAVQLAHVPDLFAQRILAAEKLWHQFAVWAAEKEGLKLPLPKLWLTPCETA